MEELNTMIAKMEKWIVYQVKNKLNNYDWGSTFYFLVWTLEFAAFASATSNINVNCLFDNHFVLQTAEVQSDHVGGCWYCPPNALLGCDMDGLWILESKDRSGASGICNVATSTWSSTKVRTPW